MISSSLEEESVSEVPDADLVQCEKLGVQGRYKSAKSEDSNAWRKGPKDGGLSDQQRRIKMLEWVSDSRKDFLRNKRSMIMSRMQR